MYIHIKNVTVKPLSKGHLRTLKVSFCRRCTFFRSGVIYMRRQNQVCFIERCPFFRGSVEKAEPSVLYREVSFIQRVLFYSFTVSNRLLKFVLSIFTELCDLRRSCVD